MTGGDLEISGDPQRKLTKPYMIAVAGGSGSGKSTVVRLLAEQCADLGISVFALDHYYRHRLELNAEQRDAINFDHPDALDSELMLSHLQALSHGQSIQQPSYDFETHLRRPQTQRLDPQPVIIVDGIFSLYFPAMYSLFNLKLYVDVADDIRFIRRLKRDISERGRSMESVAQQYLATVRPMHLKYVEPTKDQADLVVHWEQLRLPTIELLARMVRQAL